MSVSRYVRLSTAGFFDFTEIWYVDRSMTDARWYAVRPDPKSRSRSWASGVPKIALGLSPLPFTMGAGR